MRVYRMKTFRRFQRKENIGDDELREEIRRAERGLVDAELGGGLVELSALLDEGKAGARQDFASSSPIGRGRGPCLRGFAEDREGQHRRRRIERAAADRC